MESEFAKFLRAWCESKSPLTLIQVPDVNAQLDFATLLPRTVVQLEEPKDDVTLLAVNADHGCFTNEQWKERYRTVADLPSDVTPQDDLENHGYRIDIVQHLSDTFGYTPLLQPPSSDLGGQSRLVVCALPAIHLGSLQRYNEVSRWLRLARMSAIKNGYQLVILTTAVKSIPAWMVQEVDIVVTHKKNRNPPLLDGELFQVDKFRSPDFPKGSDFFVPHQKPH